MPAKEGEGGGEGEGPAPTSLSSRPCLATMYRLPADPAPSHYAVTTALDIPGRCFRTSLATRLQLERPTATIFLNSQNLQLSNIRLIDDKSGLAVAGEVTEREDTVGVLRIDLSAEVGPGAHTLALDCSGPIRQGLQGLYINKCDSGGRETELTSILLQVHRPLGAGAGRCQHHVRRHRGEVGRGTA